MTFEAQLAPSKASTIYLPSVGKLYNGANPPVPPPPGPTAWQSLMTTLQAQSSNTAARAEVTKYYAFNGSRAVMRQANNEVFYLFGDHLGSSSLVVDWQGRKISEMRYAPWGETRWAWELDGEGYTNRLYTSQIAQDRNYVGQLYDYGARFLNVRTGRFVSADSVTQDGINRYAYAKSNPLTYNDPTGHCLMLCTAAIGAVIGGIAGAVLAAGPQIISNIQQGQPLFADVDPVKVAKYAAIGAAGGAAIGAGAFLLGSTGAGAAIVEGVKAVTTRVLTSQAARSVGGYLGSVLKDTVVDVGIDGVTSAAAGESFDPLQSVVKNGTANLITGGFDKLAAGTDVATKWAPKLGFSVLGTAGGELSWSAITGEFAGKPRLTDDTKSSFAYGSFNNFAKATSQLFVEKFDEISGKIKPPRHFGRIASISAGFLSLPAKVVSSYKSKTSSQKE